MKHMNSKSNRTLSRFSIRKCSVGTASFLIGTVAFFGIHHEAFAAENSTTPVTVAQLQDQGDSNEVSTEKQDDTQAKANALSTDDSTPTTEQSKSDTEPTQNQEVNEKEATQVEQTPDNASSEFKDSAAQDETTSKDADIAQTKEAKNEALQSDSSANLSNQEAEKENTTNSESQVNEQPKADTTSDSQVSNTPQQDPTSTVPSPETSEDNRPSTELKNSETTASQTTLNEQPTESTSNQTETTKAPTNTTVANKKAPAQLKDIKGTTQLRAVSASQPTAVAAGGTNVNDKVTASDMGISESYIEPNNSGSFYLKSRFTVDGTVKEGDYFTVKMPNTVNTFGDTRHSPDYQEKLKNANGQVIALGNYDVDSHTLTYTFTDVVNNLENVTGSFNLTQFMDRQVAKDSQTYQLNYEIAGEKLDTQIRVNYGQYYTVGDSNLKSMITMEDPKSGDYEQYIYVNPLQKTANGTVVRVQGFQTDPTKSNGQVNQNATQIKILKVANDQPLNSSFGVNDGDYEDVTNQFQVNYSDKNYADINFGNLNGQRYIIKVTSKEVPDSKEDLNLRAIMATKNIYGQYNYITWDNDIVRSTSSGTADGNEASYQLGDKVWNDVNKNGIQDQGETGIADVKVTLKDLDGNILDTTYTNTNGKYIFDNLKNGNYQVDFETPEGYAASPSNQGNDSLDSDGPTNAQAVISDGNNLTVDQGFYQTETPTHNVGDKVWEDLNKDGIQDQNEPGIAKVKVTLKDADGNVVDTRTTDDKGNYLFEKVKEGEYTIEFETPEGYTPTQTGQGRVSTDSNGTSSLILVEGNDDLTIDSGFTQVTPEPPTHNVGDKVWDDLNKDGIQDDNEPGISNVKVTLKDADGNVVDTRTTDANGNYLFENVKEGDYTIEFETPEGYTPTVTGQGTSDNDSNGTSTKVTVKDGDDLTIDSGFTQVTPEPPTHNVGDKVWDDLNKDGIQDDNEPGISNVKVTLKDADGNVVDTRTTDANGNYLFENVKEGDYTIEFETPEGYTPTVTGQGTSDNDSNGTSTKVTVKDGDDLTIDSGFTQVTPEPPTEPENPSPEQPSEPGQPENPSPEQPSEPGQPENPSPEQPSEPGQPKNPSPEQPNNPSVPGVQNPEKPSLTPVTQPVHSNGNKAKPSQQQKALPETGETESHQGTLFGGILAALGALLFARKKRHDKKQSH
ncbi:SdrD B-like domain-containing protein [Staphylococcus pseudintermedius]|uniref:SdrD B-like domain-containing protein n=1 Tax=Staphylococcus pseudintermedius TaxID=283734 RepID=UPI0010329991|nr:SdrD B-like domain-containing protein [Staphylococcus pseudintermedius]QBG75743.1 YSIRK-type signal peptide-containing protein [Staphylococcus pseudintermedius]